MAETTPRSAAATTRARNAAREEIIEMLKADHRKVKKAFKDFEKLEEGDEAREQIVRQTCAELTLHAELEEQCFYGPAREALKEEDMVDEAEVEHASAKWLIEQLQSMGPDDEKFAATFTVLGEYINHHVKEEEKEMFPSLERSKVDWEAVLQEMTQRRQELAQELGLAEEEGEDEEMQAMQPPPASRGSRSRAASASRGR